MDRVTVRFEGVSWLTDNPILRIKGYDIIKYYNGNLETISILKDIIGEEKFKETILKERNKITDLDIKYSTHSDESIYDFDVDFDFDLDEETAFYLKLKYDMDFDYFVKNLNSKLVI